MITREQVADLHEGDVIRVTGWNGVLVEGPVSPGTASLWLGQHVLIRDVDGSVGHWAKRDATLTVVSRSPRPLYVNHPRTEPVAGDVVNLPEEDDDRDVTWFYDGETWRGIRYAPGQPICTDMPTPLRLLVDGQNGQVVQ